MSATRLVSWFAFTALLWPAATWSPPDASIFRFAHSLYNVSIPENCGSRTYAKQPPTEDPMGIAVGPDVNVRFRIRAGDRDKFFKAEERRIGDFCFLFIRTRTVDANFLNRERKDRYRLEVRATATRDGVDLETTATVVVTVTDTNDLNPLFYPVDYTVTVPEDTPVYGSVARVFAEDADIGINGEIYYSLSEITPEFAVHPTSGVVSIVRPLIHSEHSLYRLIVLAQDRGALFRSRGPVLASRANVTVHVERVNLHAPVISVHYLPVIAENSTTEIYAIVKVVDADRGVHGEIASLDIVDGDPDGHFRILPMEEKGEYNIVVHHLLDREKTPQGYNLTLRASDAGIPPKRSYKSVPVELADVNDNAPVFSKEIYEVDIPETAPPNTPVARLKVNDQDEGVNALVSIEIVGGNEGAEFVINSRTGMLYTAVPLDFEEKSLYTLTVSAIDQGNAGTRKQSSAKVKIRILDANDNDPIFETPSMEVNIKENEPAGTSVARVNARDRDSGENAYISYSIANIDQVPFEIDHFSGVITTTKVIDYESMKREFILKLRASDWGLPYRRQTEMQMKIKVRDVNDNRPQFERVDCVGDVPRYAPIGTDVITLSAIDFDAGNLISYRIISGNEDNCFNLDSTTGVMSVSCDLRDVRVDKRVVNVTATDGMHFADSSAVVFRLVNTKNVQREELGSFECKETGVARRLTESIAAAERNNMPPDEDVASALPSRYGLNVHAPHFVDFPVRVEVNESVSLGTTLVKLRARDRDLGYNGKLVYVISGGDGDSAFRVDPDTGELEAIGFLDRERENEYLLNVTVYDLGRPQKSASRVLPVTVLDVNDNAPEFSKRLASFRVAENAINGTVIFRANATDRDGGAWGRVSYSLVTDTSDFCVDATSGTVSVCGALDRERQSAYELVVRARDGGGLHSDALVRVRVDDINDEAPRFSSATYSVRVREDVPRGAVVAAVEASDRDSGAGGRVRYSLRDAAEDAAFAIDELSGALRTVRELDFEERQVHSLTVRATDLGQPPLSSEASVRVEIVDVDENEHAPAFPELVLTGGVAENRPPGERVLLLNATDADPPGPDSDIAYELVGGSGMGYFTVDHKGTLRTVRSLDAEQTSHYWLTVCASDHALLPRYSCVQVWVEVLDENDNAPLMEAPSYEGAVTEGAAGGTRVARVSARDADVTPSRPKYSIVAGNPDGLFSVDRDTGEIVTTGRALDREGGAEHALDVRATDARDPTLASSARVRVSLRDLNDNAPRFLDAFYSVHVPASAVELVQESAGSGESVETEEDEEEGTATVGEVGTEQTTTQEHVFVERVVAVDEDAGANGTITYALRWGRRARGRGKFRIDPTSGRISAVAPLRAGETYSLEVVATDGGRPALSGRAGASVRAVGAAASAHAPRVAPPPPLSVAELERPGLLLAVLQASDPDDDMLYYDILGDNEDWRVGRHTGHIQLARPLSWERCPGYSLNVSVSDGHHTVFTTVNVSVINDVNEEHPSFTQAEYVAEVGEDARAGARAARLEARGAPPLVFGLQDAREPSSMRLFTLDSRSGVLTLAAPLDRESMSEHVLTAWVRDVGVVSRRAYARVRVIVRDVNDHAPGWGRDIARARLPADAPVGAAVINMQATDPDTGENAQIEYSIVGGNAGETFSIDRTLGGVRVARAPAAPEYTLQVRAANPDGRAATIPLHVTVVEPSDAPPRFPSSVVRCSVWEDGGAGTPACGARATSPGPLWHELVAGDPEGRFALNPAEGALSVRLPLDHEVTPAYNLTIRAVTVGGGSATCSVLIEVLDRNEYAPSFARDVYSGRVREAQPAGALVRATDAPRALALDTRDRDGGAADQLRTFEILEPEAAELFAIDPATATISALRPLDYETTASYSFRVKVTDGGEPRLTSVGTAHVQVDVEDVNDCAPAFPQPRYNATLLLPTYTGVVVLALAAWDLDSPALRYDIVEGNDDRLFAVDSAKSILTVEKPELIKTNHALRLRASDGTFYGFADVNIKVEHSQNSGLAFRKPSYYGNVVENSTKTVIVAVVSVLGNSLDEHVQFSILNPEGMFAIGVTSGAVTSTGVAFDRETRAEYAVIVEARSAGGERAESEGGLRVARARLVVSVADVNDNCPVFAGRPYRAAAPLDGGEGYAVARVHAIDADAGENGRVRYEMKRGHGELFRVDRKTGEITLKRSLEGHGEEFALVIAAYDGGTPACGSEASVSIRVIGRDQPMFSLGSYAASVAEDARPGTALAPPARADAPAGRRVVYTLLPAERPPLFDIDPDTGVVRTLDSLDYETRASHELTVRATDRDTGAHADATYAVRVLDVNDCSPEFAQDTLELRVSEAAAPPAHLVTLRARDQDSGPNGEVEYSIVGGEDEWVSVLSNGSVYLRAALDRETRALRQLRVRATDRGRPPRASDMRLVIHVEDDNDSGPTVGAGVQACSVSADAARGQAVCRARACDADPAPALQYTLEADAGARRAFAVDPDTGVVSVRESEALRADGRMAHSLSVWASDGVRSTRARLQVTLLPSDSHAPRPLRSLVAARALENQPPPLHVATFNARDDIDAAHLTYSIPCARTAAVFSIDPTTGAIDAIVPLDREMVAEYSVEVVVSADGSLAGAGSVLVRVADLNDNAPQFALQQYRACVRTQDAPATFLTVKATDADEDDNARIKYSIYSHNGSAVRDLFTIHPDTGALSLAHKSAGCGPVQVWVRATDGGRPPLHADVSVDVSLLCGEDAPPALEATEQTFFLPETAPPGTVVGQVRVAGGNTSHEYAYSLVGGASTADLFSVDRLGRVTLQAPLDRERADSHLIGVWVEGGGGRGSLGQVRLHVLDDNDNDPEFHSDPYTVTISENTPPHSSLLRVRASDKDVGSNGAVRYSLVGHSSLFSVDAHSGWVSTCAPLDREALATHALVVAATDGGEPRREARARVVVRLQDYNDSPPRFESANYTVSVPEDALPGTVITKIMVTDADSGGPTPQLMIASGDPRCELEIRDTGELVVARALDREARAAYALRLLATDTRHTAEATVNLVVQDVNDNPPVCVRERYRATLAEDAGVGTRVLIVLTSDADEPHNSERRFYLSGEGSTDFAIDKRDGRVTVAAQLDRETRATYALVAHARDPARTDWECSSRLDIDLADVNDNAPQFSQPLYSATLPEDAQVGAFVAKVTARDADAGLNRDVRYSLADEAAAPVRVDPDTGVVTLAAGIDRETRSSHRFDVVARDRGEPSRSARAPVELTVSDVNDNPPEFLLEYYEAAVSEGAAVGARVLVVRASSEDTGVNADVYYSIVGGGDDFKIDAVGGEVTVARPLDYERAREYLLTVRATDGGTPPLSGLATVNITVTDINDNAPSFALLDYSARVTENASVGDSVIQVMADDADSGVNGRVTYSIQGGDPLGQFAIDPDTGHVSVAAALDREARDYYELQVHARDGGLPALSNLVLLRVRIEDVNDNPPRFALARHESVVHEDSPLGRVVLALEVRDADADPNAGPFTWDLLSGNEAGAFRLEQDGSLRTATRFNHKIRDRYELTVRVFDNGAPPLYADAAIEVKVVEESQYPPAVTPLDVVINSYLDEYPGGKIGRVFASDRDAYDTLVYSLAPLDGVPYPTSVFEIDRHDGTLVALPRLDVGEYRVNVTVGDGKFVSSSIVRVFVELVSDEMLAEGVVVRFRQVLDRDFVLSHRKGFVRAVRDAVGCDARDVVIVAVQPAADDSNLLRPGDDLSRRASSEPPVPRDLDVLFAVRRTSERGAASFYPSETVKKLVNANLERLEESTKLVVEDIVRNECDRHDCVNGECVEKIAVDAAQTSCIATDVSALVCPVYRREVRCSCPGGWAGARCERPAAACARGECGPARDPGAGVRLDGDGFAQYRVDKAGSADARPLQDRLDLTVRFRTLYTAGTLAYAAGRIDYIVLEVWQGRVQVRLQLGSGEGVVVADAVGVSDGAWHEARVQRAGARVRLSVDERHVVHGSAPGDHAVLDLRADHLFIGAQLHRYPSPTPGEQTVLGLIGCVSEVRLGAERLPLTESEGRGASAARAALVRAVNVRAPCPPTLPLAPACRDLPCLNGGTCTETGSLREGAGEFVCACGPRFAGARCELDTEPCASQPCLHAGICTPLPDGDFECACAPGLSGRRCERGRWCGAGDACAHGGRCEEGEWGPSCRCAGYYGPLCQVDVDECESAPCAHGATCVNLPGAYRCDCPAALGAGCGELRARAVVSGVLRALGGRWERVAALGGAAACALSLLLTCALLAAARCRRREAAQPSERAPLNTHKLDNKQLEAVQRSSKLSNLESSARACGAGAGEALLPLNNLDTLRSYGSAGDELEEMPADYRRNLNPDALRPDRWADQMHLHALKHNKIYNDLKGAGGGSRGAGARGTLPGRVLPDPRILGGYHWDCSDWAAGSGALAGISEVAGSERPDSSDHSETDCAPRRTWSSREEWGDSANNADTPTHTHTSLDNLSQFAVLPDSYMTEATDTLPLRTSSLITMLEEGEVGVASCAGDVCEIEESDCENESGTEVTHTEV